MAQDQKIQVRRGTAGPGTGSWYTVNPTLAAGEIGLETDTGKFKIGDGTTAWRTLAYAPTGATYSGNDITVKSATTITSGTTGDLLYQSAEGVTSKLNIGTTGQSLVVSEGLPSWTKPTISTDYFATTTSTQLAAVVTDATGTGGIVRSITPTLVTPAIQSGGATFAGSTSGTVTLKATAIANDSIITLPAKTDTVVVAGDLATYIQTDSGTNADFNALSLTGIKVASGTLLLPDATGGGTLAKTTIVNGYLKADGTVTMTGALNMGTKAVTNAGAIGATSVTTSGAISGNSLASSTTLSVTGTTTLSTSLSGYLYATAGVVSAIPSGNIPANAITGVMTTAQGGTNTTTWTGSGTGASVQFVTVNGAGDALTSQAGITAANISDQKNIAAGSLQNAAGTGTVTVPAGTYTIAFPASRNGETVLTTSDITGIITTTTGVTVAGSGTQNVTGAKDFQGSTTVSGALTASNATVTFSGIKSTGNNLVKINPSTGALSSGKVDLASASDVLSTSILPVANGGLGANPANSSADLATARGTLRVYVQQYQPTNISGNGYIAGYLPAVGDLWFW
jgi:hypothetical protein